MTESSAGKAPKHMQNGEFVSYSGNAEDVILHRLFGNRPTGFYIDVGAAHPTFENDTRALYDQGWSGINVEPNPALFAELSSARPRDRNFQLALSDEPGTVSYLEVIGTGLSTCDPEEAARARTKGYDIRESVIPCTTLATLLDEVSPLAIDLLKVDVEGLELRVLRGNDWDRYRPSVILVEATYPETPQRRPDEIRPFLEQNGYDFTYFDGLNDFFVDRSFVFPENAFRPPNVFDRVQHHTAVSLRRHVENLENDQDVQRKYIESLQEHLAAKQARVEELQQQLDALTADEARSREAASYREARIRNQAAIVQARMRQEAAQAIKAAHLSGENLILLRRELERAALRGFSSQPNLEPPSTDIESLRALLAATRASTSWRVTYPLRVVAQLIRGR